MRLWRHGQIQLDFYEQVQYKGGGRGDLVLYEWTATTTLEVTRLR